VQGIGMKVWIQRHVCLVMVAGWLWTSCKSIVFTIMGEITIEEELSLFCTVEPCRMHDPGFSFLVIIEDSNCNEG